MCAGGSEAMDPNMLIAAAQYGDLQEVQRQVEADPDQWGAIQEALMWAIGAGRVEVMLYLLDDVGLYVNYRNPESGVPMYEAAIQGFTHILEMLLERGADPWFMTQEGETALHGAAASDLAPALQLLLERFPPGCLDFPNNQGETALHHACTLHPGLRVDHGVDATRTLLKAGADPMALAADYKSCMRRALDSNAKGCVEVLQVRRRMIARTKLGSSFRLTSASLCCHRLPHQEWEVIYRIVKARRVCDLLSKLCH